MAAEKYYYFVFVLPGGKKWKAKRKADGGTYVPEELWPALEADIKSGAAQIVQTGEGFFKPEEFLKAPPLSGKEYDTFYPQVLRLPEGDQLKDEVVRQKTLDYIKTCNIRGIAHADENWQVLELEYLDLVFEDPDVILKSLE